MIYLLYGFGISNESLARYLKEKKVDFRILDDSEASQKRATEAGYQLFSEDLWPQVSLAVVTPGVSRNAANPVVAKCRQMKIEVTNDVSMFIDLCSGFCIGVTGSFGKSTSVALFKHIYDEFLDWTKTNSAENTVGLASGNAQNFDTSFSFESRISLAKNTLTQISLQLGSPSEPFQIAGNYGIPCFDCDPSKPTIFELSAQQLQISNQPKLQIGVILNLYEQHLDDFGTMQNYLAAKKRILENSTIKIVGDGVYEVPGAKRISTKDSNNSEYAMINEILYEKNIAIAHIKTHLSPDSVITAYAIARELQIPPEIAIQAITSTWRDLQKQEKSDKYDESIKDSNEQAKSYQLKAFGGLEHRCEVVELEGRFVVNDSKSTNIANTIYCINSFKNFRKLALICGGKSMKQELKMLNLIIDKIAFVACIGSSEEIYNYFDSKNIPSISGSLEHCLEACWETELPIIFSPGYASTDQYRNFEERGKIFKELCRNKKAFSCKNS